MTQPTVPETLLARPRAGLVAVTLVLPLACWIWVVAMARDMYGPMSGASAWMMTVTWDWPRLLLLWAMWAAMMAAMMLPTMTPALLLYARVMRRRGDEAAAVARINLMAAGYVLVWALFSVGATALQRALSNTSVLTTMMEPASPRVAAVLLLIAAAYQWTPLKTACLHHCRSPIALFTTGWREGQSGAFRMGVEQGVYCLGCCWALMLLLFAGGVMNLAVILALTAWVAIEKVAPFGQQSARVSGALLAAMAIWLLVR